MKDEVWLFEYTLPDEGAFTVHFHGNKVVDVVWTLAFFGAL